MLYLGTQLKEDRRTEREIDQDKKKGGGRGAKGKMIEGRKEEREEGRMEDLNIPEEKKMLRSWHNNQNTKLTYL